MLVKHENELKCVMRLNNKRATFIGFLVLFIILISTYINVDNINSDEPSNQRRRFNPIENYRSNFIKKKKCRIPLVNPFNESAKKFVKNLTSLNCDHERQLPLTEANQTAVYINPSAFEHYYDKEDIADCCWQFFEREDFNDNSVKFDTTCHKFNNSVNISAEFIRVKCFKNGTEIYRDYHFFVPRKPQVESRCQIIEKKNKEKSINNKFNRDNLSVLILGLDTMSRLHFHRTMPKTIKTLKSIGAVEMLGYNKVADNTYPNLIPVLTGLSQGEIESSCNIKGSLPFDDCPLIWKNFSAAGYRTVFGEDISHTTLFNNYRKGFFNQPTDYYFRPFIHTADDDLGNRLQLNYNLCIGARKASNILLDYAKKIAQEFKSDRYFSFLWEASLTHDFPYHSQMGDDSYSDTINYLFNQGLLNNTALVVMSDHGERAGEFRQTDQGRLENSLPGLFFVLPKWWKEKFPLAFKNLQYNTNSLTTPFDLHETLIDLLHPETITNRNIRNRNKIISNGNLPRGISFFLTIPEERDCLMAEIPDQFCICHETIDIPVNDAKVERMANFAVDELNRILEEYPQCSSLKLNKLKDAKVWSSFNEENNSTLIRWITHIITFETIPGNAIFQATIKNNSLTYALHLPGFVDRLNIYGNQSWCINNPSVEPYCYCNEKFN